MQGRYAQAFALLGGLGRDGGQPDRVDPADHRALRHDRKQGRRAKFRRLLHDKLRRIPLEHREDEPDVGFRRLRPQLRFDRERRAVATDRHDPAPPFPVAAVEQAHRVARFPAHDRGEIVSLRGGSGEHGGRVEIVAHKEADRPGHAARESSSHAHAHRHRRRGLGRPDAHRLDTLHPAGPPGSADRSWLLFLPGLWGILLSRQPAGETIRLVLLFAAGSLVMRAAGCVVNDLWDRDIDRQISRTAGRPLASGALTARKALLFLAVLLATGLLVLLQLNPLAQMLGLASLVLVGLYPLAKRVTWWPQLVMGFTFGYGAPLGYAAGAGRLTWAWAALYAAAVLWDLGFDTIYAHQDREDDALVGVKSTARLFGERTGPFLAACYSGTVLMLAVAGWAAGLSFWFYPALLAPALLLGRQVVALDIHDPALCLRLFKSNRQAGLAVAAALLIGRL